MARRKAQRLLRARPCVHSAEAGQATVEFALTLILSLAFILFFIQLALVLAWGNYVQYATFMAARALLSASQNPDEAVERARQVLVRTVKAGPGRSNVDRFPTIARAYGGGDVRGAEIGPGSAFSDRDRNLSWMQGVRYTFRSRLFLIPLPGSGSVTSPANSLTLTSEAWLGRDPDYNSCVEDMGAKKGLIDNGC